MDTTMLIILDTLAADLREKRQALLSPSPAGILRRMRDAVVALAVYQDTLAQAREEGVL